MLNFKRHHTVPMTPSCHRLVSAEATAAGLFGCLVLFALAVAAFGWFSRNSSTASDTAPPALHSSVLRLHRIYYASVAKSGAPRLA